jgi:hypothetical protein
MSVAALLAGAASTPALEDSDGEVQEAGGLAGAAPPDTPGRCPVADLLAELGARQPSARRPAALLVAEGLRAAGRPHQKRAFGAFVGERYRGPAQSQYLHECKRKKRAQQEALEQIEEKEQLADAWNIIVLRAGDMVGGAPSGHANKYSMAGSERGLEASRSNGA